MTRYRPLLLLGAVTLAATACGTVPIGAPTVDVAAMQDRTQRIDAHSSRADVHALLGEPWLANEALGVEVYRQEGKQRALGLIFVLPVPVPSSTLRAYALVVYEDDGTVLASDAGFAQAEAGSTATVALQAGEFRFTHSSRATLSMSHERFRHWQAAVPRDDCTLLIACDASRLDAIQGQGFCSCAVRYAVGTVEARPAVILDPAFVNPGKLSEADCRAVGGAYGDQGSAWPGSCVVNPHVLYPVALTRGPQHLRFARTPRSQGVDKMVDCARGEEWFAIASGKFMSCMRLDPPTSDGQSSGDTVTISRRAPSARSTLWVVVNDEGTWLLR